MATENILVCCFSATQGLNIRCLYIYTLYAASNRLNTGDKLIITSLVAKDAYIRSCISLIRYHANIRYHAYHANIRYHANIYVLSLNYLAQRWWLGTQFFESKLMSEKISCFEMTNFRALDTLIVYSNISKLRLLIQITLCRNARIQIYISKNNRFSAEEAINYIPSRREKK